MTGISSIQNQLSLLTSSANHSIPELNNPEFNWHLFLSLLPYLQIVRLSQYTPVTPASIYTTESRLSKVCEVKEMKMTLSILQLVLLLVIQGIASASLLDISDAGKLHLTRLLIPITDRQRLGRLRLDSEQKPRRISSRNQ